MDDLGARVPPKVKNKLEIYGAQRCLGQVSYFPTYSVETFNSKTSLGHCTTVNLLTSVNI